MTPENAQSFRETWLLEQQRLRIDKERDRRISTGFIFQGKTIQLDDHSGLSLSQMVMKASLSGEEFSTEWIATDNTRLLLDRTAMLAMGVAAIDWIERHTMAGRDLKEMDPMPEDFDDDYYW